MTPGVRQNLLVQMTGQALAVDFGVPFVAVAKIVALSLVVSVIAVLASRASSRHAALIGGVFAIAIVAGLVGGWSNAAVIL